MAARIKVPEDVVRTREAILEGQIIRDGCVWLTCWNCGGSGNYASSMLPPGRCRLYCWARPSSDPMAFPGTMVSKSHDDPTFGKLPRGVEEFVKREQAADRRAYRECIRYEAEAPERERRAAEHRARIEAARAAEDARREAELAAKAARRHVGDVGARIRLVVCVDAVVRFDGYMAGQSRYLVRFRDSDENALVWWTASPGALERGDQIEISATVKAHETYRDEPQTVLLRVKPSSVPSPTGARN